MKIVVIADIGWSVGRVNSDIANELTEHTFIFYNSASFIIQDFFNDVNDCDIVLTTFNIYFDMDELIKNAKDRKKILLVCHGISDIRYIMNNPKFTGLSSDFTYSVTSDVLVPFFPIKPYITENGVNSDHFTYTKRPGVIESLGWVGAYSIPIKNIDWSYKIGWATKLPVTIASSMPFNKLIKLYQNIDILLVTSGPEEYEETGPLPPFEAIASGVLVIGTSVGNFSHVPGPKFKTIEEAAQIINELKNDPERVLSIIKEQYEFVMENYTYKKLAKKWNTVFEYIHEGKT